MAAATPSTVYLPLRSSLLLVSPEVIVVVATSTQSRLMQTRKLARAEHAAADNFLAHYLVFRVDSYSVRLASGALLFVDSNTRCAVEAFEHKDASVAANAPLRRSRSEVQRHVTIFALRTLQMWVVSAKLQSLAQLPSLECCSAWRVDNQQQCSYCNPTALACLQTVAYCSSSGRLPVN